MNSPDHRRSLRATWRFSTALAAVGLWFASTMLIPGAAGVTLGQFGQGNLSLQAPSTSTTGQDVQATVVWQPSFGQKVAGQSVTLFMDFGAVGKAVTDGSGNAGFTIPGSRLTAPGSHSLRAVAGGGGFGRFGGAWINSNLVSLTIVAGPTVVPVPVVPVPVVPVPVVPPPPPPVQVTPKPTPIGTTLAISAPTTASLGQDVAVTATIQDAAGLPLAGQYLTVVFDGNQLFGGATDANGQIATTIAGKRLKQAGAYTVQAVFSGTHQYNPAAVASTFTVTTAAIAIKTVPPVQGLQFSLAGASAYTGADGVATLPVPASGTYKLTSDMNPDLAEGAPVRASIVRWDDGVTTADRMIVVAGSATHTVGLRVASAANIGFVDEANNPIDPAAVSEAVFGASDGTTVTLNAQTGTDQIWWTSSTMAPAPSIDITPTPVSYRATSVKVHGVEVLAPGQQSWTPGSGANWSIKLQLYTLTVHSQDAFLGAPVSGQVRLAFPDGASKVALVGGGGTATFYGLPAGRYSLTLDVGAPTELHETVTVPTDQVRTMRFVTFGDAAMAITPGIGLAALALFVIVRRRILRRRGMIA